MAIKTRQHKIHLPEPRSFAGLMGLYESNFRRFARLLPEIDIPFEQAVSKSASDRDLHLRVLERCKYTTTINLTYRFEPGDAEGASEKVIADPDLNLRIYRDAELVEAVGCDLGSRYAAMAGIELVDGDMLAAQWPRNLLLNKWLAYCLQQGHGFSAAHRPRHACK